MDCLTSNPFLGISAAIGSMVLFVVALAIAMFVILLITGLIGGIVEFVRVRVKRLYKKCHVCGHKIWGSRRGCIDPDVAAKWKGTRGLLGFLNHPMRCYIPDEYQSIYSRLWKEADEESR